MPEVTIVGAGATGCTLALLLARYGIASTVIERRSSSLNHPAAHVINARSQEIWRRASPKLAAQIAALAPPSEENTTRALAERPLRRAVFGDKGLFQTPIAVVRRLGAKLSTGAVTVLR